MSSKHFLFVAAVLMAGLAPAAASAGEYGACVIRISNAMSYWAPDVGPGYVKQNIAENDLYAARARS